MNEVLLLSSFLLSSVCKNTKLTFVIELFRTEFRDKTLFFQKSLFDLVLNLEILRKGQIHVCLLLVKCSSCDVSAHCSLRVSPNMISFKLVCCP